MASSRYEKRIASYLKRHPDATRQQARGKKAGEHVIRKQKERNKQQQTGAPTSSQKQAARKWFMKQAERLDGADPETTWQLYKSRFEKNGWSWFVRIRERQASYHKRWVELGKPPTGQMIGSVRRLAQIAIDELDADDFMLFYH